MGATSATSTTTAAAISCANLSGVGIVVSDIAQSAKTKYCGDENDFHVFSDIHNISFN